MVVKEKVIRQKVNQNKLNEFLSKGGSHSKENNKTDVDYRMTLRIPRHLLKKIDEKRLRRPGRVSRTLWIIEQIEKGASL